MKNLLLKAILLTVLLLGLPMAGILLTGKSPGPYLEFPPQTRYVAHAPFSWTIFIMLALLPVTICGPFLTRLFFTMQPEPIIAKKLQPFPGWGLAGLCVVLIFWVLAWNRFSWFEPLQPYTFLPLWLGFILVMNGLTFSRTGHCQLTSQPLFFAALFPLSALFWWYFEYLNRFVQNWFYLGIEDFTRQEYIFHATLCFSTVLPAVLSTVEWLSSHSTLTNGLNKMRPLHIRRTTLYGWTVLLVFSAGLLGIGIWPDFLFPLLWISPLAIITAIQAVQGEKTVFSCLRRGDWSPIWIPAFAALVCGFFWEMWNYKSYAHWEYSVPYVQRFHLFHMPILGYAGYLPFGLECVVVTDLLRGVFEVTRYEMKPPIRRQQT